MENITLELTEDQATTVLQRITTDLDFDSESFGEDIDNGSEPTDTNLFKVLVIALMISSKLGKMQDVDRDVVEQIVTHRLDLSLKATLMYRPLYPGDWVPYPIVTPDASPIEDSNSYALKLN